MSIDNLNKSVQSLREVKLVKPEPDTLVFPLNWSQSVSTTDERTKYVDSLAPAIPVPTEMEHMRTILSELNGKKNIDKVHKDFNELTLPKQKNAVIRYLNRVFLGWKFEYYKDFQTLNLNMEIELRLIFPEKDLILDTSLKIYFDGKYDDNLLISEVQTIQFVFPQSFEGNYDLWIHCPDLSKLVNNETSALT